MMPTPFGRDAGSTTKIEAMPTTAGTTSAPISIPTRSKSSETMPGAGTAATRKAPTYGSSTPIASAPQMTEPKVMSARTIWRSLGTRPNRSVEAQPSIVVRTLPANRPTNPRRPARIAIA